MKRAIPLLLFVLAVPAQAHDHLNLERGIPVSLEDAYPTAFMNREAQAVSRYVRTADETDRFELVPRLEYGFVRNGQVTLEVPVVLQQGQNEGSGDIELEALYNFNYERLVFPAVSVAGAALFPSGVGSRGVDTTLELLLTKTLSRSAYFHRIHLNAAWVHNSAARGDERDDRYRLALGYQWRVGPNNHMLLNLLREQVEERDKESNVVELGLRHQWNPLTVFAIGLGAGLGPDSPTFRATLGFQKALNLFY